MPNQQPELWQHKIVPQRWTASQQGSPSYLQLVQLHQVEVPRLPSSSLFQPERRFLRS